MRKKLALFAGRLAGIVTDIVDLRDLFAFAGLGMVCYGVAQIYPPAAWIVGGGMFWWIGARC